MKQSVMTAKEICNHISQLRKELADLASACDMILDDLGKDNLAYKILDKQYNDKKIELSKAESTTYERSTFTKIHKGGIEC